MKKIFLIRHGSAYDENSCQEANYSLNQSGTKHAEALAERFKGHKVDQVFSSTMERAKDTCTVFLKHHHKIKPVLDYRLREVLDEKCAYKHEGLVTRIAEFDITRSLVYKTLLSLIHDSDGENIFIFTHGHWIMFAVMAILMSESRAFFDMRVDFTSVTVLHAHTDGKLELVLFNDCSHTKGLEHGCSWC